MKVCGICNHPQRAAVDAALVDGTPLRAIAGQYGTAKSALDRHKKHLAPALTKAKQAEEVVEATSLLSRVERIMSRVELIAEQATKSKKWLPAVAASRELRSCLELLGRLSGEIQSGTRIGIGINAGGRGMVQIGSDEWRSSMVEFLDELLAESDEQEKQALGAKHGLMPQFNVNFVESDGDGHPAPRRLN
jgi:hypothetical protein